MKKSIKFCLYTMIYVGVFTLSTSAVASQDNEVTIVTPPPAQTQPAAPVDMPSEPKPSEPKKDEATSPPPPAAIKEIKPAVEPKEIKPAPEPKETQPAPEPTPAPKKEEIPPQPVAPTPPPANVIKVEPPQAPVPPSATPPAPQVTPAMPPHMRHRRHLYEGRERGIVVPPQPAVIPPTPVPAPAPVPAPTPVIIKPTPRTHIIVPTPSNPEPATPGKRVIVQPDTSEDQETYFRRRIREDASRERQLWESQSYMRDHALRVRVREDLDYRAQELRRRAWEDMEERDNELRYLEWRDRELQRRTWEERGRICYFKTYYQKITRVNKRAKVCVWRNGVYTCYHPKRYYIYPVTRIVCYRIRENY